MSHDALQTLMVEKVVPGGHGLARHDGRVVLVRGAIPGETVRARVQRTGKGGVIFADVVEVVDASADRIEPAADARCGGLAFAHVRYARQLQLKREMLSDALQRTARLADLPQVDVIASPVDGWRVRARLHVQEGQVGFYREGTHTLCTPPASQLPRRLAEAARAVLAAAPAEVRGAIAGLIIAEDTAATRLAAHLDLVPHARVREWEGPLPAGVSGVTVARAGRAIAATAGDPGLIESVAALCKRDLPGDIRWQPGGFFQANRFIVPCLVEHVLASLADGPVIDLFAGVGLFGVCAAAAGSKAVWCVEGDEVSGGDLRQNAAPWDGRVQVRAQSVEDFVHTEAARLDGATLVVDPPRAGLSPRVCEALCRARGARLIYVSCDAATFARDLRRLHDAGYRLSRLEAYDMFPATAHLETLAVLDRDGG